MSEKKVLQRETKEGVAQMSLDDFLKVVNSALKEVDDVMSAHEHFKNLSDDGKYAFICSEIEWIADETGKDYKQVIAEIKEVMTENKEDK